MPSLLTYWMALSARVVSRGPLVVTTDTTLSEADLRAGVRLAHQSQVVAIVRDPEVAELVIEGPIGLRSLVEALSVEWDAHAPLGDWCRECGKPVPCPTRQRLGNMLTRDALGDDGGNGDGGGERR